MKKWIALFSQTGSEIKRLAIEFDRWPDIILTNNANVKDWEDNVPANTVVLSPSNINMFLATLAEPEKYIVTLHGYLRIIPGDICDRLDMYNGHPGLITLYPELKGKDPQEMVWKGNYGMIGSVVHKCTAELDGGEIVKSVSYVNRSITKEDLYNTLKDASYYAWSFFLKDKL